MRTRFRELARIRVATIAKRDNDRIGGRVFPLGARSGIFVWFRQVHATRYVLGELPCERLQLSRLTEESQGEENELRIHRFMKENARVKVACVQLDR